jgi:hypothetical protein
MRGSDVRIFETMHEASLWLEASRRRRMLRCGQGARLFLMGAKPGAMDLVVLVEANRAVVKQRR